jgi:replication fork protection complex subunit Tof1/Swi1
MRRRNSPRWKPTGNGRMTCGRLFSHSRHSSWFALPKLLCARCSTPSQRFANADVTNTLLIYLGRYKEFGTAHEKMKRVVALMHRQAVRAKAEGLFFKVSALDLFKHILADSKSLPKDQAYKDLLALVNFILRKFFKAAEQEPFLLMEAFFPKNRGQWKAFSSLTPEELAMKTGKSSGVEKTTVDHWFPQDVQVKKGYSWSEQVGIAVKALVEDEKKELVEWTQDVCTPIFGSGG